MARSSAKATCRAASLTGCQSESWAPRSTSSISARERAKGARSSTSAAARRCRACTPSAGAAMLRTLPVPTADSPYPSGPCTSTTRRPARCRLNVRVASCPICAQAAAETGASSRCRLSIARCPFQAADLEGSVWSGRARRRRLGRRTGSGFAGRRADGAKVLQQRHGGHEEQAPGHRRAEVQQPVVVSLRAADEHVSEHLLDRGGGASVADEIGAVAPVPHRAERHVVPDDLHFLAVVPGDGGQRVVRGAGFYVIG